MKITANFTSLITQTKIKKLPHAALWNKNNVVQTFCMMARCWHIPQTGRILCRLTVRLLEALKLANPTKKVSFPKSTKKMRLNCTEICTKAEELGIRSLPCTNISQCACV